MNALKMVKKVEREDGYAGYEIDADDLYPTALAALKDAVEDEALPPRDTALQPLYSQALALSPDDWKLASKAASVIAKLSEEQRTRREIVLELARLWFTEVLHGEVNYKPMALRITADKDNRWRL